MVDTSHDSNAPATDRARFNRPRGNREWALIEKVMLDQQQEQRRTRRWNLVFRFAVLAYLIIALLVFQPGNWVADGPNESDPHVGVVDVLGPIMPDTEANADRLIQGVRAAFEAKASRGVLLRINSPGGTPVQSGQVYREVQRYRQLYPEKKVYAVITDVGASGAYYIAAAADEIYADPASLVGSIGVISDSFGFVRALDKLGVERRIFAAGENKAMLDPFSPLDPQQAEFYSTILTDVHQQFVDAVKQGRGDRLQEDARVFSGLFWSGRQALELGLVDGLASAGQVAREIVGVDALVDYTPRLTPLEEVTGLLGVSIADRVLSVLGVDRTLQLR